MKIYARSYETAGGPCFFAFQHRRNVTRHTTDLRRLGFRKFGPVVERIIPEWKHRGSKARKGPPNRPR